MSNKLICLSFDKMNVRLSKDNAIQQTFVKYSNLRWI